MEIKLKEGAKLPRVGQRRFTREEAIEIKKQLNELEKAGKIQNQDQNQQSRHYLWKKRIKLKDGVWTLDQSTKLR
jgi:hypothetical protein